MNAEADGIIPFEEPSEVAFQLLADWWMDSIQALVDMVGSSKALDLLRPHYRNAGISANLILKEYLGMVDKDRASWGFCQKISFDFWTRGNPNLFRMDIREKGGIARVLDCPFKDGPFEICMLVCEILPNASLDNCDPEYEMVMISRLSQGDPECVWMTKPKSWSFPYNTVDIGEVKADILPRMFPKKVVDDFSIQYLAEFWVISARAFVEQFGGTRAASIMNSYMKHRGTSFGLRFMGSSKTREVGIAKARECVGHCTEAFRMVGEGYGSVQDGWEYTVTDCPFKDAPPEVCEEFRSFCEGICEAIAPELVFSYDRMMTRGDETCHWVIRKRVESSSKEKEKIVQNVSDDPTKILKMRFIRGEISEQEYRKMKKVLEE